MFNHSLGANFKIHFLIIKCTFGSVYMLSQKSIPMFCVAVVKYLRLICLGRW